MDAIFVGSKAAFGLFCKNYGGTSNIPHVADYAQLRGRSYSMVFYSRQERGRNAQWHALITEALRFVVSPTTQPQPPPSHNHNVGIGSYGPLQVNTTQQYYTAASGGQQLTFNTSSGTQGNRMRFEDLSMDEIRQMKEWFDNADPQAKTCMWCAAAFQTTEELEAHEEGCGR